MARKGAQMLGLSNLLFGHADPSEAPARRILLQKSLVCPKANVFEALSGNHSKIFCHGAR